MENPNMSYINELSGDNIEFKAKIIAIIKKELPEEIAIYHDQIQKSDFNAAATSVHKLKHKISILGMEKKYYLAENHENNLKQNSTQLEFDFESILKSMQDFVNTL